jgi:hypothetical protein
MKRPGRLKRVMRWVFNGLAVLSLLLCVATCNLWVRSCSWSDYLRWWNKAQTFAVGVRSDPDGLNCWLLTAQQAIPIAPPVGFSRNSDSTALVGHGLLHFSYVHGRYGTVQGEQEWEFAFPYWTIAVPLALPSAIRFLIWWRRPKTGHTGLCVACGYNLTGNVSGICPECGTGVIPLGRNDEHLI